MENKKNSRLVDALLLLLIIQLKEAHRLIKRRLHQFPGILHVPVLLNVIDYLMDKSNLPMI